MENLEGQGTHSLPSTSFQRQQQQQFPSIGYETYLHGDTMGEALSPTWSCFGKMNERLPNQGSWGKSFQRAKLGGMKQDGTRKLVLQMCEIGEERNSGIWQLYFLMEPWQVSSYRKESAEGRSSLLPPIPPLLPSRAHYQDESIVWRYSLSSKCLKQKHFRLVSWKYCMKEVPLA